MDRECAIPPGDEFAYNDLPEIRDIQFLGGIVGGDKPPAPPPITTEMEVYDEQKHIIDVYSLTDADRMRVLLREFDDNISDAARFNRVIGEIAQIRAVFRQQKNAEIMARQLVSIGQEPRLFGAILIIPTVQFVSQSSFMDRLRKQNPQQVIKGRIVRAYKTKKPTTDIKLTIPPSERSAASAPASAPTPTPTPTPTRKILTGVQFPREILANVKLSENTQSRVIVAPNTSVLITHLEIYNIEGTFTRDQLYDRGKLNGGLHFDCIGLQEDVRPPTHIDVSEPRTIEHVIAMDDPEIAEKCKRAFDYLMRAFEHVRAARASDDIGATRLRPSTDDFAKATEDISVVKLSPIHEKLIECAHALGERQIGGKTQGYMTLNFTEDMNVIGDFIKQSSFELYWQIRYSEIPTLKLVSIIRNAINTRNAAQNSIEDHKNNIYRLGILAALIDDNFGSTKLHAIARVSGRMRTISLTTSNEDELLAKLTEKERAFILAKYEELYTSLATMVPCEHSRLVQQLKVAVHIKGIARILGKLEQLLEPQQSRKENEMIKCTSCKQRTICPHIIELARARVNRATRQQERAILFNYVETIPERKIYFCRICGEHFEWRFITVDDVEKAGSQNKALASMIKEKLDSMYGLIISRAVGDQSAFHSFVLITIYPLVEELEQKMSLAQTNIATELDAKLKIVITIYIYAFCIVNMEKYKITFDSFIPRDPTNYQVSATRYALDKIISFENVALRLVPSMTREIILGNLTHAIKQLRALSANMPIGKEEPRDYRTYLIYDPVYHILSRGECSRMLARQHQTVRDLLGQKPQDPRIIYKPLFACCNKKDPFIASLIRGMELRAFDYPFDTTNRAIVEYRTACASLSDKQIKKETIQHGARYLNNIIPRIFVLQDEGAHNASELQISRIYDEKGREHIWSILVFKQTGTQFVEHKLGDPNAFADASLQFVDVKCATCGIMRDDLMRGRVKLDEDKITDLLKTRQKLTNFYKFFEIRCPEGEQHTFEGDVCKKCEYSRVLASNLDASYYEKYLQTFIEYLTAEDTTTQTMGRRIRSDDEYIEKAAHALASRAWTFNFDIIIKTATTFKLERHVLQALGAHEGLTAEQLNDESFVARVPKTRVDIRIQSLRECLRDIIIIYSVIKRIPLHEKILYKSIALFIEEYRKKLPAATIEECVNSMPTIGALITSALETSDVSELNKLGNPRDELFPAILTRMLDTFIATRKAAEIVDFHIEMICKFILAIHEIGTPCAVVLAKQTVARIVERETMVLKSEHYNLSVVEGTKLASEDFDMATAENVVDDLYEEEQHEEEEDEAAFSSLDAFDVDNARDDDDIAVDEDDQPLIHVGDEAGW